MDRAPLHFTSLLLAAAAELASCVVQTQAAELAFLFLESFSALAPSLARSLARSLDRSIDRSDDVSR